MKKSVILTLGLLCISLSLTAAESWVGIQAYAHCNNNNPALALWGDELPAESRATFAGATVLGTFFPSKRSPVGIGVQIGASEMVKLDNAKLNDYPLEWRGALTMQYRCKVFGYLSMELGCGVIGTRMNKAMGSGSSEIRATLNALSLLTTANLFLPLSESFSLTGGIGASLPLITQRKIGRQDNCDSSNIDVEAITVHAQVGLALTL